MMIIIQIPKEKIKSFCVVVLFITVVSFIIAELYTRLLPTISLHTTVFMFCVPLIWLFVDNVTLGIDLAQYYTQQQMALERENQLKSTKASAQQLNYENLAMNTYHVANKVFLKKTNELNENGIKQRAKSPQESFNFPDIKSEEEDDALRNSPLYGDGDALPVVIAYYRWALLAAKYRQIYYIQKIKCLHDFSRAFCTCLSKYHLSDFKFVGKPLFSRSFSDPKTTSQDDLALKEIKEKAIKRWSSFKL
jgi:hypothetical protein